MDCRVKPGNDEKAVIARSGSDEAIQSCFVALGCFAEPVIGRRFAPTRWLAMTENPRYAPKKHSREGLS
jgi:hypothetical protein